MIRLTDLVEASQEVGSTTRKKEKISILAGFLRRAEGKEISLAASYLAGQVPQGRMGVGWANLQEVLRGLPERNRPLGLREVDETFEKVSLEKGAGSAGRKLSHLKDLFSGMGKEERNFLTRVHGEVHVNNPYS